MKKSNKGSVTMTSLESRVLMHGGFAGGFHDFALHGGEGRDGAGGGCGAGVHVGEHFGAGGLGIFLPTSPNATVQADLTKLQTDRQALWTAVQALSTADRTTLRADKQAIRTAIQALSTQLTSVQATLETDEKTWRTKIRTDQKTVATDNANGTDPTADLATLKSDQAAGLTAVTADKAAVKAIIDADASVTAAKAKLATDLPTIAAAEALVQSDMTQLITDVQAQLNA